MLVQATIMSVLRSSHFSAGLCASIFDASPIQFYTQQAQWIFKNKNPTYHSSAQNHSKPFQFAQTKSLSLQDSLKTLHNFFSPYPLLLNPLSWKVRSHLRALDLLFALLEMLFPQMSVCIASSFTSTDLSPMVTFLVRASGLLSL